MDFLKKGFDKVSGAIDSVENKVSEVKDSLIDYIPEIDFSFIEKELVNLGYVITKLEIHLTIPPRMSLEIDLKRSNVNLAMQNELKDSIDPVTEAANINISKKVLFKIIQGLESAVKFQNKITFSDKELSRVKIEGSMIPTISLIYLNKDEDNYIYT